MPAQADILVSLVEGVRVQLDRQRRAIPLAELEARVRDRPPPPAFATALRRPGLSVIAEIKRASPSKGVLAREFDHRRLARAYEGGGAAAISVLTEEQRFLGSIEHLRDVYHELNGRMPLLRKDFLVDEYQLYQAREAGAAAVLLIVAILKAPQLAEMIGRATEIGLDALVEVHDEPEVDIALAAGATIIGVNNRDLRTFETDITTSSRLRAVIPRSAIMISESGILDRADADRLRALPVDAILVGEHLMTATDPADRLRQLL